MTSESKGDRSFEMMLRCPAAYGAKAKGFGRAVAAGMTPAQAALICGLSPEEYRASVGVVKRFKRAAKRAGRGVRRGLRQAGRVQSLQAVARGGKSIGKGLARATAGIRRRIFKAFFGKLVNRRARLIAYQRRRRLQPDHAEVQAAGRWAWAYIRHKGRFGRLVAAALAGEVGAEPATSALLTASIPVLLDLARRALRQAEGEGAPADPRSSGVPGSPALDPDSAASVTPAAGEG